MTLLCKSLPASYACWRGAEVLHRTGRLQLQNNSLAPFTRRLMETAQFVVDVMKPDGLSPEGRAIRTAQKVRLMHASIRYYLKQTGKWDTNVYNEPINQEDMLGTLLAFSTYTVEGLEQLNIHLTTEEKDAFIHIWNVIGIVMGVKEDLLPNNFEQASKIGHRILEHQKGESQAGKELTEACVAFVKNAVPGNFFDFFPVVLMRYFLGDEVSNILGISQYSPILEKILTSVCKHLFGKLDHVMDNHGMIRAIAQHFNRLFLQGLINFYNHDKQIGFQIPPSLTENWLAKDKDLWENVWASPVILDYRAVIQRKY
jgi:hypothetical protein